MTLLELKKRIEDAIEEYGEHPVVHLSPYHSDDYEYVRNVDFESCVNCDTDEEEIDIEFRV